MIAGFYFMIPLIYLMFWGVFDYIRQILKAVYNKEY